MNPSVHGCAVSINGRGVLIEGPSGSGKTSLAFGLLDAAKRLETKAALVADDRVVLRLRDDTVFAHVPAALAGKAEIRGYGIVEVAYQASVELALIAVLCADEAVERLPEPAFRDIFGIPLPLVKVPARHEARAVRIILASLGIPLV